jgi:hypothetical protein
VPAFSSQPPQGRRPNAAGPGGLSSLPIRIFSPSATQKSERVDKQQNDGNQQGVDDEGLD